MLNEFNITPFEFIYSQVSNHKYLVVSSTNDIKIGINTFVGIHSQSADAFKKVFLLIKLRIESPNEHPKIKCRDSTAGSTGTYTTYVKSSFMEGYYFTPESLREAAINTLFKLLDDVFSTIKDSGYPITENIKKVTDYFTTVLESEITLYEAPKQVEYTPIWEV